MQLKALFVQNKNALLYLLTTLVLPLSVSSYWSIYIIQHEQAFHLFTPQEWALALLITTFTMALALTPTTFIALISGYFLGLASIPWLVMSYLCASIIGYSLAKYIGSKPLKTSIEHSPNLATVVNGIKEYEYTVIFLTRISPILPFALINGVLGILHCDLKKFILAGTLGMLPRTILFIFVGQEVSNVIELFKSGKPMSITQYSFYALLLISVVGILWIFGKIAKKIQANISQNITP
jgi:uncharacterized membrane protein YdjX (TVP38/TMEM64 family)